jgi:hypothetical protein
LDISSRRPSRSTKTLDQEDARPQAAEPLRGLLDAIVLYPEGERLGIQVQGNLAAMLQLATNAKRPSEMDLAIPVKMVAGADNQRYLQRSLQAA